MRVLLIYPPITRWERYSSDMGNAGGRQIPLGIFSIASYVRSLGHTVDVIDSEALGISARRTMEKAVAFSPDVIGLSSTTVAFHRALEVARLAKAALPRVPVVIGGPHLTVDPQGVMQNPEFDYGVAGEGEDIFARLLAALEAGTGTMDIPGLAIRANGQVRVNERPPLIPNLDILPMPAYDLVPDFFAYNPPPCNYKKLPVANVITARGCPNQCTFCDRSVFGNRLRQRSPQNIAAEIETLYRRHHVREIAFVDDTFTIGPQRIHDLFDMLDKKGIRFPWTCMSRINTVDLETLRYMRDKGCWHISFGIESGSQEILSLIKKKISLDDARRVLAWCRKLGILTKGFFIIGHPGETGKTIAQTISFALDSAMDDVVVTLNTPLPGSEQFENVGNYGTLSLADWSRFNLWNPVFVPHGLTRDILVASQKEFYRKFYLRPRPMARYAASFLSPTGLRRAAALAKSLPFLVRGHQRS